MELSIVILNILQFLSISFFITGILWALSILPFPFLNSPKSKKPFIISASEMKEKMQKHTNKVKNKKEKIMKKALKFIEYLIEESLQKGCEEIYISKYFNFEYNSSRTFQLVKFHRLDILAEIIKAGYNINEVKDEDYTSYKIDLREFYKE